MPIFWTVHIHTENVCLSRSWLAGPTTRSNTRRTHTRLANAISNVVWTNGCIRMGTFVTAYAGGKERYKRWLATKCLFVICVVVVVERRL